MGETLLAGDPQTGAVKECRILQTFVREVSLIFDLQVGDHTIGCSAEHPFWVIDQGWTPANKLQVGDALVTSDGQVMRVEAVRSRLEKVTVYNFEVEHLHTYFVSDLGILVHNTNCERPYVPSPKHEPGGWGTEMDLDPTTAQQVLNNGLLGPNGRQVYGYHNGRMYEFQPDNVGSYHGYPVPGNEVPTAVLRTLRDSGVITRTEYNRFLRGKS